MNGPRIGSLFSGYGGLEQGVQSVLGGTVAWHSEIDPGARKILAHRYPDVPNLGDITAVDWSAVEPVDVLVGGFPCQDVSAAGLRKGLHPDTRSGLWTQFAYAIDQLRPPLVVIENVRGLLSAEAHHPAHADLEPCPWCVGDDDGLPLRALGAVLGDLAGLGFHAEWVGVRASDVGAPHERFRVFVVAWPAADTDSLGHERGRLARHGWTGPTDGTLPAAHPDRDAIREQPVPLPGRSGAAVAGLVGADVATDAQGDGRHEGRAQPARLVGGPDAALGGDAAAHADQLGRGPHVADLRAGQPDAHRRTATDPDSSPLVQRVEPGMGARNHPHRRRPVDWGIYTAAIRRWERVLGRPAPSPTEPGGSGMGRIRQFAHEHNIDGYTAREMLRSGKWGARQTPPFVEWMQGLLLGWVTGVPGLTRNEQLKALGNGVVPQQAAEALRRLLPAVVERAS
jgi:DNA (cytosine-5)-methyltransferase 1